jgi:2-polyprenyl-6-methoxyphenol hydroxylase-like FAD-dependent oxidoreductase
VTISLGLLKNPPQFGAAVSAERSPFIQAIFDYAAPIMSTKRIALLGDAAFVVRPHTGMGVSKAAGDALALSYAVAKPTTSLWREADKRPAASQVRVRWAAID